MIRTMVKFLGFHLIISGLTFLLGFNNLAKTKSLPINRLTHSQAQLYSLKGFVKDAS